MKKIVTILSVGLIILSLVVQAFANENTRYPQPEAVIRVNGIIGPVEDPIVEDETTDSETTPVKPETHAPPLPETGATMVNMSVVGLSLLLVAGVTIYLKK